MMRAEIAHDLECASAAYATLVERAEAKGDRQLAKTLRKEWREFYATSIACLHEDKTSTGAE